MTGGIQGVRMISEACGAGPHKLTPSGSDDACDWWMVVMEELMRDSIRGAKKPVCRLEGV